MLPSTKVYGFSSCSALWSLSSGEYAFLPCFLLLFPSFFLFLILIFLSSVFLPSALACITCVLLLLFLGDASYAVLCFLYYCSFVCFSCMAGCTYTYLLLPSSLSEEELESLRFRENKSIFWLMVLFSSFNRKLEKTIKERSNLKYNMYLLYCEFWL